MKLRAATRLARRLRVMFPDSFATEEWVEVVAERLERWDEATTARAVERLIDSASRLPTVSEIRDAYSAEGGDLPDPGRRMSPPTATRPSLSEADEREAAVARREAVEKVRALADERRYSPGSADDEAEGGRGTRADGRG